MFLINIKIIYYNQINKKPKKNQKTKKKQKNKIKKQKNKKTKKKINFLSLLKNKHKKYIKLFNIKTQNQKILKFDKKYNSVTSLAELEKRLPSKHLYIGSNPIGCIN